MLRTRLYYTLKPWMPRAFRMWLRRLEAQRALRHSADTWPILESAGRKPEGWPGWPDGKKFAVVLTHDVESQVGVDRVKQLAQLEMELGFRSSFNFIPEGEYRVPDDLRKWLTDNGFEVGVHDHRHDGKLYRSREGFRKSAERINGYLREWGAVGFRSGFMLHKLDWIHDLNIVYDASTFDTDPFEPQPDGVGTIFPFWVPAPRSGAQSAERMAQGAGRRAQGAPPSVLGLRSSEKSGPLSPLLSPLSSSAPRAGYVELPYTLVQDSTLFFLLRAKSPEIWIRKADWVAEKGGMVLLNLHPDYIGFGTEPNAFAANHYRNFLQHLRDRHAGNYWHVLPREVANWVGSNGQPKASASAAPREVAKTGALEGRRVAVLLYSYYPSDPRPRRAALAMAEAGARVEFICLRASPDEPRHQNVDGISVARLATRKTRGSKLNYMFQYAGFIVRCMAILAWRTLGRRYDLVHAHNMPDVLAFAALPAKLRGARVILDFHDPMPELMTSIYGLRPSHPLVRLLLKLERWSIRFADLAFTPNITFKNLFVSRGCPPDKMQIIMNSPEETVFDPAKYGAKQTPPRGKGEFRIMHHGSIVHRHGVDLLVEAVAAIRPSVPGVCLDIYGDPTPFLVEVRRTAERLGISDIVHFHGSKAQPEIAEAITHCHLGVVPNRRSSFTETNFPTRLFEYLAMNRPVVAPRTQGITDYFGESEILFFDPDAIESLGRRILWAYQHPAETQAVVDRGIQVYQRHLWSGERAHLVGFAAGLLNR